MLEQALKITQTKQSSLKEQGIKTQGSVIKLMRQPSRNVVSPATRDLTKSSNGRSRSNLRTMSAAKLTFDRRDSTDQVKASRKILQTTRSSLKLESMKSQTLKEGARSTTNLHHALIGATNRTHSRNGDSMLQTSSSLNRLRASFDQHHILGSASVYQIQRATDAIRSLEVSMLFELERIKRPNSGI